MPASIAALLRRADLGLTLLSGSGSDRVHAPIRWVTTSELVDPTPYLRGGELLLTTGMRLPAPRSAVAQYVNRLVRAGVLGIGFGIGSDLAHRSVPPRLTHAAEAAGLPLLLVDEPTPFIAIGEAVAKLHLADETAALAQALKAQQAITRAAVTAGPEGVVRQLAALTEGWAIVTDISGEVLHEAPAGASARHTRWRAELGRLRGGRSTSAAVSEPGEYLAVQALGDGHRLRGFLVTGRTSRPGTAHHSRTNGAAALLSVAADADVAAAAGHLGPARVPALTPGPDPLTALARYQRRSHAPLVDSLRVWLECHGRTATAAAKLGIHRNTLAHRIERAGDLLGRNLNDAAARAELWAALQGGRR
jgi:purine catabolism regulator